MSPEEWLKTQGSKPEKVVSPEEWAASQAKPKKNVQDDIFKEAALGTLSNVESVARGVAAGVPATVGIPGSLSVLGQKGVNIAAERMGLQRPFDEKTRLPEAGPIFEKTLGIIPRVTRTRPETKGMEELGSLYSPSLAPSAALTALRGIGVPIKAGGKAVEYAQKAGGKGAETAAEALRRGLPGYTSEAERLLGKAESAQTLAERARRARQETGLRKAGEEFAGKAQKESEARAAKFADLGQPADPAKLGDEMQRRLTGTEFTRESRRGQQAARDYDAYFKQAEGFEDSAARNVMLQRLEAMSVSPSVGSAGRKYAAQALKDLQESETAFGAEKEFRKYFEQASAPQQAGYGAVEQEANRAVSDIISEALNSHAPLRVETRTNYKEFSTPLDAYETLFGKKGVAKESKVPDRLQMMPSDYPSRYFKNRDTVNVLREQLAGDEAAVRKFGNQHAVNELSGKNASQAQDWLDKNQSWIDAIPGLNDRVKRYVYELAQSEKTEKSLAEKAKKVETKRGEIVSAREKTEAQIAQEAKTVREDLEKSLRQLDLLDADKVPVAANQMLKYLSDKQLLPAERLRELKSQIDAVTQTYKDANQAKTAIQALIRKAGLYSGLGLGGAAGYYGYKSLSD